MPASLAASRKGRRRTHTSRNVRSIASTRTWLAAVLAAVYLLSVAASVSAQTTAALNQPEKATATAVITSTRGGSDVTSAGPSSTSVDRPASTEVAPISLSPQQVPYLLGSPAAQVKNLSLNSGGAVRGPTFTGCNDAEDTALYAVASSRINISAVYTQFDAASSDSALGLQYPYQKGTLRIVGIGTVGNESHAFGTSTDANGQINGLLSAIQVSTSFLTFPVFDNYTYLCDRLYPTGNDTLYPHVNPPSCQYGPGTVAFGVDIPLNHTYDAGTLWTQIRLTDPSTPPLTLACIEVQASPYYPDEWYWSLIFYVPIAIVAALMALVTLALLITAETNQRMAYRHRAREGGAPTFFKDSLRPMMISALGGKEQVLSPSLLRFITPGCWDVIWYLQFLIAIAMCHVEWPDFVFPFFREVAWSALLGNVTVIEDASMAHGLLHTNATLPDGDFGTQMGNVSSPLFMNASQPNTLLNLGAGGDGMHTFAAAIGLQPSNLFGTCLVIWLAIVAIIFAASALGWVLDACVESYYRFQYRRAEASGEILGSWTSETKRSSAMSPDGSTHPLTSIGKSSSTRFRGHFGSHGRALHGNIVRAIVLFHLPITIMSTYQLAAASEHSKVSVGLAGLAFAFLSVIAPIYIIWRLASTPPNTLYEDTHTLLSLGSVYHMFAPGSQLFISIVFVHQLVLGIAVGAGQNSGAAQAIVILIIEIAAALVWSLWLPWGDGAMMGPMTFLTGVFRITTAVLLLLLTSLVGFSKEARGWLSYVILLLQGIYFAGLLLVVALKVVEALVRIVWRLRFDTKVSGRTAGLTGAIRKLKRRKMKKQRAATTSRKIQLKSMMPANHRRSASFGTVSTLNMLEKPGVAGRHTPGTMSDARRQYLEKGNGASGAYLSPGDRPQSGSDLDYFYDGRSSRPVSGFLPTLGRGGDLDENGSIMAAMPPLTPGGYAPGEGQSFVRVGGARATDRDPYGTHRSSAFDTSGATSPWGYTGGAGGGGSYRPVQGRPSNDAGGYHSSTQLAARSARQSLLDMPMAGHASAPRKTQGGFRERFLRAWGRTTRGDATDTDSDDDGEEDEDDVDAMALGAGAATARKGDQNKSRFSSAIGGMRKVLPGSAPKNGTSTDTSAPSGDEVEHAASGFEVVRPKRARPSATAPTANPSATTPLTSQQTSQERPSEGVMERSAEDFYKVHDTSPVQPQPHELYSDPSNTSQELLRSPQPPPSPPNVARHPSGLDLDQRPFGMLGADLQHGPSSAGHTGQDTHVDAHGNVRRQNDANAEERFWLPPLDLQPSREEHGHAM